MMDDDDQMVVRIEPNLQKTSQELADLVERCYREKPDKKDLRALKEALDLHPKLWSNVFDLTDVIRQQINSEIIAPPAALEAVEANMEDMKIEMGYYTAPMVEKLLIDSVVTAWLRYQWAELRYTQRTKGAHSMRDGEYWLQVMGAAQRRYLHTVETLARVRRITRATMQINIAEPGSQQVNIAGDLVKKQNDGLIGPPGSAR